MDNTGEGQLHISVFDTTRGMPINNADIKITPRGEPSNILEDKRTDDSGVTRKC